MIAGSTSRRFRVVFRRLGAGAFVVALLVAYWRWKQRQQKKKLQSRAARSISEELNFYKEGIHKINPDTEAKLNRCQEYFSKNVVEGKMHSPADGTEIHFYNFKATSGDPTAPALVLLTGWSESCVKYAEFVQEVQEKCDVGVYMMDHRSQGFSSRIHSGDTKMSVVHEFEHHEVDAEAFIAQNVPKEASKIIVLGFSLGGLVAARIALRLNPEWRKMEETNLQKDVANAYERRTFDKLILCCPALSPLTGFPNRLAYLVARFVCFLGFGERYVYGMPTLIDHRLKMPPLNGVSSCTTRIMHWQHLRAENPITIVNGLSYAHLREFLRAELTTPQQAKMLGLPTLLISAENDMFVDNEAHKNLSGHAPNCKSLFVKNALHEVLQEKDELRDSAMQEIINFIRQN